MAGNTVSVKLTATNDTGPAFASAVAGTAAMARATEMSSRKIQSASDNITRARFKQVSAASKLLEAERFVDAEAEKATRI